MEASLQDILAAREHRAARQRQLLTQYKKPLLCFTVNIAGPVKNSPLIEAGFSLGLELLRAQLTAPVYFEESRTDTGCQAFFVCDMAPSDLKRLAVQIEDYAPVGRLFDMDVLDVEGRKLQRETLGLPPRTCLLCGQPAMVCSRSRAHSVEALQAKTRALLCEALEEKRTRAIGQCAVQGLLYEVCTTPKPGLVDRQNSGSHRDMDIFTFMSSTAALTAYFEECAAIGSRSRDTAPREVMQALRLPGRLAEQAMHQATGGVNTHKGAIFTMGLLCAAAGRCEDRTPSAILDTCAAMAQGITGELQGVTAEAAKTAGQRLFAQYGITGVRGQAEAGFPAVRDVGLPVLERGLAQGLSLNDAGCAALLWLMTAATDTNLIARSNLETQQKTVAELAALLEDTPYPSRDVLEALDAKFQEARLSPGGSADLLAATYFLHFLTEQVLPQPEPRPCCGAPTSLPLMSF